MLFFALKRLFHVPFMQDCEGGIPIDYLTKLDTEYRAFVKEMQQSAYTSVVSVDWNEFGPTTKVKQCLRHQSENNLELLLC